MPQRHPINHFKPLGIAMRTGDKFASAETVRHRDLNRTHQALPWNISEAVRSLLPHSAASICPSLRHKAKRLRVQSWIASFVCISWSRSR